MDSIIHAQNDLGWRMLWDQPDANALASPVSIGAALGMTLAAARGRTADELAAAFRTTGEHDAVHRDLAALASKIRRFEFPGATPAYIWRQAARLWAGVRPGEPLASILRDRYGSDGGLLTGRDEEDAAAINAWIAEHTCGRITRLVSPPDLHLAKLVVASAVYLKAPWALPFEELHTEDAPFTLASGRKAMTPMMRHELDARYAVIGEVAMASIPLRGDLSFIAVLPARGPLNKLLPAMTSDLFARWDRDARTTPIDLRMPRFGISTRSSLSETLRAIGIESAFKSSADFSGFGPLPLFIGNIVHAAEIEVSEEGIEASAASASVLALGIPDPKATAPIPFHLDRPFLFAIRHDPTGADLFVGRVEDPTV